MVDDIIIKMDRSTACVCHLCGSRAGYIRILGYPVFWYRFLNEPKKLVRLLRWKGNVLYKSYFSLECDQNPGMLQEIERGAISFVNDHEVDPCSSHFYQQRYLIDMAFIDVIQRHFPGKDAKFELEGLRCQMDDQCLVVHWVEKEKEEETRKNYGKDIHPDCVQTPYK